MQPKRSGLAVQQPLTMSQKSRGIPDRAGYAEGSLTDWTVLARLYRPSEWLLILFFTYTAFLAVSFNLPPARRAAALAIPVLLCVLGYLESFSSRRATIVRDWVPVGMVLIAYWELAWFQSRHHLVALERHWLTWDHTLLISWGFRAVIESLGGLIPSVLEITYTLLYAIPPLSIGVLYLYGRRDRVETFLFPFLLGTFIAYGLLPHFPTASPRVEFANTDLPLIVTIWRRLNLWILQHGDIDTGVFPSGHVTVAFSAAFAMMRALPEKPWLGRVLLGMAVSILTATIYGRYHYAADGLAGLLLSITAIWVAGVLRRD
ncbi:MAG TPA: phosphatase PAP2 family protein [Bryobacteraceae bacterium]|nr:phosphatase PAP2 family protein [Bryobacteraceae bacterium]